MENQMDPTNPVSLGEMARGYFRGKLLCAAVRLGIADTLGDAEKDLNDNARHILKNCRAATASGGRLLVIEAVLPTQVVLPDPVFEKLLMADINMLAVTGGRERSEAEWSSLLGSAGFEVSQITPVPGTTSSIIESVPSE